MACEFFIYNPVGSYGYVPYEIGSGYGWRYHPVEQTNLFHFGIDIPTPEGEYVRAAQGGAVSTSRMAGDAGNLIEIEHPGGYQTRYMHLQNRLVQPGETVRAGDIIGSVGSTGRVTGPHLHFEIRKPGGAAVDPTGCYNVAEHVIPYEITQAEQEQQEHQQGIPHWVWWAGGGVLLLIGAGIAYDQYKKRQ